MSNQYLALASKFSNELRLLESSLIEINQGKMLKSFCITSSKQGEGKTLIALSFAKKLAEQDKQKVLLIDGNSERPVLHDVFEKPLAPGLCELANEMATSEEAIHTTSIENLDFLSFGISQRKLSHNMRSEQYKTLIASLSDNYDYIIMDTNAVLGSSEVSMVCPLFDATLLVVECESTKRQVVKTAADKIIASGGKLLGTVMNKRRFYIPRFFYG